MAQNPMRILLLAAATLCCAAHAQQSLNNPYIQPQLTVRQLPINQGATALWQELQRLHTRASLLMIVAHPDDEDGGMLTYESRGIGVRTGMLTLNRGEGGQNVMTGDFDGALGLIRTQELLSADRYLGVDQMWGSVVDFGFSKTMDETLANWGYDRVLCDAVYAVRKYRPLVITSVFIGGVTDGHGHHQVAGRLAQVVFTAAGDASVCPDQIKDGLQPWQPLKVYARVPTFSISDKGIYDYATGKYAPARFYNYVDKNWSDQAPSTNVIIPEGAYNPLLGMSYLQFARLGLGEQKTQNGGGSVPPAGEFGMLYHRYGSRVPVSDNENSFFDGIDTSLMGIALLAPRDENLPKGLGDVEKDVTAAMAQFSITDTAKIAPLLADGLRHINNLLEELSRANMPAQQKYDVQQELLLKQAQFNDALVDALGLSLRAQVASEPVGNALIPRLRENADTPLAVTPGEKFNVSVTVNNPSPISLEYLFVMLPLQASGCEDCSLSHNHNDVHNSVVKVDEPIDTTTNTHEVSGVSGEPTEPYFSRPSMEQPYYDLTDSTLQGQSTSPYPLTAWATMRYDGIPITLGQVVQTAHRVVGQGMVYQPLVIVPAISVALQPTAGIIPLDAKTLHLTANVRTDAPDGASGTVHLKIPDGWSASPTAAPFHFTHRGDESSIDFTITTQNLSTTSYTIEAIADSNGRQYTEGYTTIGYPGLTPTNLYRPAVYRASGVDFHIAPGLRIAYLPGTGDDVPSSLTALGVSVHILSMSELATTDLSQYDEIVLGVRAYAAHPNLPQYSTRLISYANAGGVIIAQYNSAPFASTPQHPLAPYPFTLSGPSPSIAENVVEEHAPVTLLLPQHPLFAWPNAITAHDFDGWVEERGHSFLRTWDPRYDALTETHDDGQDPQRGGLLYARTGCGAYVYVAYALYRELPQGVPGAYRLFANLLSLPKNPQAVGGDGCAQRH